ncbi:MaoC family dehydratase [Streptomyces gilvus]|uniref:MaoC family dehydratase n=1 Tax=Streptomyces gilvus TaxID=2920937 RepID=UPI001F0E5C6A|nr:MaoC family dehydratase [Streptomyces sp. CME 23]MCH5675634.1 MaoC family dehydratase [Streptomyces sp. CME 23]
MTPRVFRSVDEVKSAIDEPIGPSDWLVVDQERVNAFADATGDHQWIHVDVERAATGPFGGTIAHGYLTLSLIPYFALQLFRFELNSPRVNYGINKVRFPTPVPVGSSLRAQATFVDLREAATGATLTTRYTIEIDGRPKPACVAETMTLLLPTRGN